VPPFAQGFVRDLRPRWACEEMGLAYRERLISAMERPEWYFDEQPFGQVPYMRDGDVGMFESGAMLIHLAEKGGTLLPTSGPARAQVLSWLLAALNSLEPRVFEMTNVTVFSRREEWAKLRRPSLETALGERLDQIAKALGENEWIAGDFSIADIVMATVLREVGNNGLLAEHAGLAAYVERAASRPAFQTALAAQLAPFEANAPKQTEGA